MSGYKSDHAGTKRPGIIEHWCMAEGCKEWGTYGFKTRYGQLWFCYEHRQEGNDAMAGVGRRDRQ